MKSLIRKWLGIASEAAPPVQIASLSLGENDIVVITTEDCLTKDQAEMIRAQWEAAIAAGHRAVVLSAGLKLQVLHRPA